MKLEIPLEHSKLAVDHFAVAHTFMTQITQHAAAKDVSDDMFQEGIERALETLTDTQLEYLSCALEKTVNSIEQCKPFIGMEAIRRLAQRHAKSTQN